MHNKVQQELLIFIDKWAKRYKGAKETVVNYKGIDVRLCDPFTKGVHVFEGIEIMAMAAGKKLEAFDDSHGFYYKGVLFFQLKG